MKNTTRNLGTMTVLIVLSMLAVQPAFAENRRDYQHNRQHDNHQPFSQSYYNHQYQKYQDRRYGGHHNRSRDQGYGHRYANSHNYSGHYAQYNGYERNYSGYRSDHHRHRHGIVVLRSPAYGYTHCETHGGYYRDGDIYY